LIRSGRTTTTHHQQTCGRVRDESDIVPEKRRYSKLLLHADGDDDGLEGMD